MRTRIICSLVLLVTWVAAAKYEPAVLPPGGLASQVAELREAIEMVRLEMREHKVGTAETNERTTLDWAKTSVDEVHMEMKEMQREINITALLNQIAELRNEIKRSESERVDLAHMMRKHEARIDKMDSELQRLKYENRQLKGNLSEIGSKITTVSDEIKNHILECSDKSYNNVEHELPHGHKIRHSKMIHSQISRLAKAQEDVDATINNLRTQIIDLERRVGRAEEPNWNLMETKMEISEMENRILKQQIMNLTSQLENVDKLHASVLELREDVEGIEDKSGKSMPEIRKEISKLEVCMAQLTAHTSYIKEDQESLRQSVKAIAVSVSNTMDRLERERDALAEVNNTVSTLQRSSRQHFHRLNDHIHKFEAKNDNETITDLPDLMEKVMDLEPMKEHYDVLISELPRDCSHVEGPPAAYLIHTSNNYENPIETWCDNRETVVQRRCNGTEDFNRNMAAYAEGFGHPEGEIWLGLKHMHKITNDNCYGMRIIMTDIYGKIWHAKYDHFMVGDAYTGYKLHVSGFSGNASDAFAFHNQMKFSTMDVDRDVSRSHCAMNYEGGWWYSHCQHVNINGKYSLGLTWFDVKRNEWIAVVTSEMRLFRRKDC